MSGDSPGSQRPARSSRPARTVRDALDRAVSLSL
jgi:hypothetical protein